MEKQRAWKLRGAIEPATRVAGSRTGAPNATSCEDTGDVVLPVGARVSLGLTPSSKAAPGTASLRLDPNG